MPFLTGIPNKPQNHGVSCLAVTLDCFYDVIVYCVMSHFPDTFDAKYKTAWQIATDFDNLYRCWASWPLATKPNIYRYRYFQYHWHQYQYWYCYWYSGTSIIQTVVYQFMFRQVNNTGIIFLVFIVPALHWNHVINFYGLYIYII